MLAARSGSGKDQSTQHWSTDAVAPVPVVSITPPTDKAGLRTRTKSESALGAKSKRNGGNGACKELPAPRGDDWTLSLPLPSSLTKIKTKGQSSSAEAAPAVRKKASVITVAGVECLLDESASSGSAIDTDEEVHDCASLVSDSHTTTPVLPVVFSVPRVVSQGSGIERAARSKDKIKAFVLPGAIDEDILNEPRTDANSARLEILSADLARFNEMLRHGKSMLELRTKGVQQGEDEFSATHSLGVPGQGRSGLRHARSHGTIDADDASPKKAILRIPSAGHLFNGDVKTKARAPVSPSATLDVPSTETAAAPSGSVVIENALPTPSATDIAEFDEEAEALREVLPPAPAATLPVPRSRVVSTASAASAASAATITPAKARVRLPFASSSSVCGYAKSPSSPVSLKSSEVPCLESPVTHVRPGLASGSALNPRTMKRSRSTGTPHALTIVTTPSALIPRDSVVVPENDVSKGETTPTKASSSVPIFSVPSTSFNNIAPGSSTPSSPSTPTDFDPRTSLTPRSAPIQSCTSAHTRHASSSSLATITSISSPGSTSSKTPTGSPVYDSSAAPTPLASAFPIPPPFIGPPPSFGRSSGLQVASDLGISKDTPNRNAGVGPRLPDPPTSRSSSLSSSKPATAIVGSTRAVAPNLEQRIRQLRMLGVDAGMPAVAVVNSMSAAEKEATAAKSDKEAETDTDSMSSGPYYSARSSFSSER